MALTISDIGNGTSTTSTASVATGSTVTASVGDWLVAIVAADNNGTNGAASLTDVQDSQSNTWTQRALINRDPGAAAAGATLGIFTAAITNPLSAGTVTANFSPNTTAKAIQVYRVQPGVGEAVQFVAADATGSSGSTMTHSAATVSVASGNTIFGGAAIQSGTTTNTTGDSDTTNGSWSSVIDRNASLGVDTSMLCASQYKTVSSTGNQSWAVTTSATRQSARSYLVIGPVSTGTSGTASITEADDTVSAAGTVTLKGTASITEASDTLSSAVTLLIKGTASPAEAGDTLSSTATLLIKGTLSTTEASDTLAATGVLPITGTLSVTEAGDTLSAQGAGQPVTTGTLDVTEADDSLSATAALAITGTASLTEADDAVSAEATVSDQPIIAVRRFAYDPRHDKDRKEFERQQQDWQEDLRRIIDQAWDTATTEPPPLPEPEPLDLSFINEALAQAQAAQDQANIDAFIADQQRLQEEEAIAVLLLAS